MKARVFIILIVIQAITCEKTVSKLRKKLMVPKMNEECKKIKCPSVEEPLCVKMIRHDLGRSMHIVAANRCELEYIKCHDDVEAKIVPMKYCGHNAALRVGDKKNKMSKHIRVKRRVASTNSKIKRVRGAEESHNQTKLFELNKARLNRKKLARMQRNNLISNVISKNSVRNDIIRLKKKHGADQHGRQNPGLLLSTETDSDLFINKKFKIKQELAGHKIAVAEDSEDSDSQLSPKALFLPNKIDERGNRTYKNGLNDVVNIQKNQIQQLQRSLNLEDFDMFSGESTGISTEMLDHSDESCPTVCPSGDVMVCGRCQHGIYKTFPSVCHMKMFGCHHPDEVLELISRYPCMLSAPYLSEEGMKPRGRIQKADVDDEILKFLNCQKGGFVKDLNGKISCASSFATDPAERYKEGDRYFYFPGDGDNTMHLVDATQPIDFQFIKNFTKNPANNGYWLYTRSNPFYAQTIRFGDASSVAQSNLNFSKVTVFLAHGWWGHGENDMNRLLTEVFLLDKDVNVIVLDWSILANKWYPTAKAGTAAVGRGLGKFINWLVTLGASYERMHLVGFSLGGHLVGNAGRETGGLVRRITALDPACPFWKSDNERVVRTDAQYVEVIHTNTFLFGFYDPCGDADFYPNGGSRMPGCFFCTCSHSRAYEYMASSVKYNYFIANKCKTLTEATQNSFCHGEISLMGNSDLSKSRPGIYRVNTWDEYPF